MNLRQQFFWKLLIGLSTFIIIVSLYNSYSKYSELAEYKKEYKRESEVKDNKKMERKTDFISSKQNDRIKYNPDLVFLPFPDRHIDHRIIFDGGVVACRPKGKKFPKTVLLYETLSETHWNAPHIESNFTPNWVVDITQHIDIKLKALKSLSLVKGSSRSKHYL